MQLQTFNTPQDDIATMNVGYSTQPVHDNGYNKYPQNNFNPNQANGDHDRNGNTQIRSNGEYIHVSPSKQNYQCENSKDSPDLCSTFRSPEHENPYSYHIFTAGHQGSGHSRKYNENYNGLPRSSRAGQSHQDGLNPSCHGQEMSRTVILNTQALQAITKPLTQSQTMPLPTLRRQEATPSIPMNYALRLMSFSLRMSKPKSQRPLGTCLL